MQRENRRERNNPGAEGSAVQPESTVQRPEATDTRPERAYPPNHIFVGKKPIMTYAMSALIQLAQSGEIIIKARGMVISAAVDVAEVVTKRLGNNVYEVKSVAIGTERLGEVGQERNVSTIEIVVGRK